MYDIINGSFEAGSAGLISNISASHSTTLIQEDSPLSLTGGEFHFQFNSTVDGGAVLGTAVGLTRCTRTQIGSNLPATSGNDQLTIPSYYEPIVYDEDDIPSELTFFDYVIRCEADEDEGEANHVLKLYHSVSDRDGELYMQEFDYRVNASDINSDTGYFTTDATGSVDPWIAKVFWTVSNEQVKVVLEDYEGEQYTLCDGTNSNKLNSMKPVGQTSWSLFPKITIPACNPVVPVAPRFMKMLKWEGVQIPNYKYGSVLSLGTAQNQPRTKELYQDWWAYCVNTDKEITDCFNVDRRSPFDYSSGPSGIGKAYTQKGLHTFGGTINSDVVLIVRTDPSYPSKGANAGLLLGFGDNPVIDSTFYTTPVSNLITTIKSTETPVLISSSSMFVRLGGLTQVSANMSKSANSKIIYHLPRFDNAGNESGALYFSPAERVYINLVKGNEQLADNITGKTVCCLHIK